MLDFKKRKNIIITGYNDLSISLAKELGQKHNITLLTKKDFNFIDNISIEKTDNIIKKINEKKINENNIIIAATKDENFNLIVKKIAYNKGINSSFAFIYSDFYSDIALKNVIYIFNYLLEEINNKISNNKIKMVKELIPGKINVIQIEKINNLSWLNPDQIIAVKRKNNLILYNKKYDLLKNDKIYYLKKAGLLFNKNFNKIIINGANKFTEYIIEKNPKNIIIFEKNKYICEILANKYTSTMIINGNLIDARLFLEEGIDSKSLFLSNSENTADSILATYIAQKMGCQNTITIINKNEYIKVADLLKLNNFININKLLSKKILNYINLKDSQLAYRLFYKIIYKNNKNFSFSKENMKKIIINDNLFYFYRQ